MDNNYIQEKKVYLLLLCSLFYITFSLTCGPLAFRLVSFYGYVFTGSMLIFPLLYPLLDMIANVGGRIMAIRLILLFHFLDFLNTYLLYGTSKLPTVGNLALSHAYSLVVTPLPRLFWGGIAGAIVAGIAEVLIYGILQQRWKSFFFPSLCATVVVLVGHNIPTEYFAFHKIFPDLFVKIILGNLMIGIFIALLASVALNSIAVRRKRRAYARFDQLR